MLSTISSTLSVGLGSEVSFFCRDAKSTEGLLDGQGNWKPGEDRGLINRGGVVATAVLFLICVLRRNNSAVGMLLVCYLNILTMAQSVK